MLLGEARAARFPMRLCWMAVQTYVQPRAIKAYGGLSNAVVSLQGILAGCSMATTLLMVLLHRSLTRAVAAFPNVRPRALIDDISFQWVGERVMARRAGGRDGGLGSSVGHFS